jgi:hypothetical protein
LKEKGKNERKRKICCIRSTVNIEVSRKSTKLSFLDGEGGNVGF